MIVASPHDCASARKSVKVLKDSECSNPSRLRPDYDHKRTQGGHGAMPPPLAL